MSFSRSFLKEPRWYEKLSSDGGYVGRRHTAESGTAEYEDKLYLK